MNGNKPNGTTLYVTRSADTSNSAALSPFPLPCAITSPPISDPIPQTSLLLLPNDNDTLLLVRNPRAAGNPGRPSLDDPVRIYVYLLARPQIMHGCHADTSCHLGVTRTLKMLQRYYWWIGMEACTKWWVLRCLKCQARKTSRQTVRWPILPIPLPNSPGISVSVDYFGPLPTTTRGNSYILLFTDRFSRRADMFAVTAAEFAAEGTANILVNRYIPLWGCSSTLLSDNGPQFCTQLATAVY